MNGIINGEIRINDKNALEIYVDGAWKEANPYIKIQALERENAELKAEIATLKAFARGSK